MKTTTHPLRAARQEAAVKRQAVRDTRSVTEQLAMLADRPGDSARERARLESSEAAQ